MKDLSCLEKDEIGVVVNVMVKNKFTQDEFKPYFIGTISLDNDTEHKNNPHWYIWQNLVNATLFKDPEEFFNKVKQIREDMEKYESGWEIDWSGIISFYTVSVNHLVTFDKINWDK